MSAPENPSAFPIPDERDADGCGIREGSRGMALLDYFAIHAPISEEMALNCHGADHGVDLSDDEQRAGYFATIASMRFEFARVMLAERGKGMV